MQYEVDHLPCHRHRTLGVCRRSGLVGSAEDWGWVTIPCWVAKGALTHIPLNTADLVAWFSSPVSVARDELPRLALLQSWLHLAKR
jgi:hypothetical protein